MDAEQVRARILGSVTLQEVEQAFTGAHPDRPEYRWDCRVDMRGSFVHVEGEVYCEATVIGEFSRRLYYERGYRRAQHIKMEIQRQHQDHGIAKNHYRDVLQMYKRWGIRYVHLDADAEGPAIWPQFAFDLQSRKHKELLARTMREFGIKNVPSDPRTLFAPDVLDVENASGDTNGVPLGIRIIKELHKRAGQPLPMVLDLENPGQWTLLVSRGIVAP